MMSSLMETVLTLLVALVSMVTSALVQGLRRLLFGHRTEVLPQLYFTESDRNRFLIENCSSLSRMFCPPWWMVNQHTQTIIPVFLPKPDVTYKRELVNLNDGGVLAIDWAVTGTESFNQDTPIIFILPGLAGNANDYKELALYAAEKGLRPVVFNKRGLGGCRITTPKLQSFGDSSDFKQAIEYVRQKYPIAPITAVGFSAGSGLLVSYLGAEKDKTPLVANVNISPGYDAQRLFKEYLHAPYNFLLLTELKKIVRKKKDVLSQKVDIDSVLAATTVAEFEERLYCPIYGFKSANEYWAENNPNRDQYDIQAPLLSISALDDPICPKDLIPFRLFGEKENMILVTLESGGHCGFREEGSLANWAEATAIDYILAVLKFRANE